MARMVWTLFVVLFAGWAVAEEPEIPLRKLAVTAATAPVPALKYRLLPELRETAPGNAALLYYRAFSPDWWRSLHNKELPEKVNEALDKAAAEVKAMPELAFVRDWGALKEVDRAARRSHCDWEMTPRVREEGIMMLLPDVQSMREFLRYLKIRAKLELADLQFDKAEYTLQTGFQMGRHVATAPTLIQSLVGAAITAVMLNEVEEWIQTPGSPNLYWALTYLPQPFIDLRMPLQGEKLFFDNLLPGYREALADPTKIPPTLTPDQRKKMGEVIGEPNESTLWLAMLATKKYAAAKKYLLEHGRTPEQIEALPVLSAVMLYEVAMYDRLYDEMLKVNGLPYWIARPYLNHAEESVKEFAGQSGTRGLSLAGLLMPALLKVHVAGVKQDRTINLLRTVEALRIYAAANGKWPEKLADITDVPMPIDPITGQPFEYRLEGDKAILIAPPPPGEPAYEGNSRRFEIMLKK